MSDWAAVKHYAALFEAEMDRHTLEESGIPVMVKGPMTGAFGPGFAGPTTQGVTLLVPGDRYDEARELIGEDEAQ